VTGTGRGATPHSESANSFLRVPGAAVSASRSARGRLAAPPATEAAAYSRSSRLARCLDAPAPSRRYCGHAAWQYRGCGDPGLTRNGASHCAEGACGAGVESGWRDPVVRARSATPSRRAGYPLDDTVCATEARCAVACPVPNDTILRHRAGRAAACSVPRQDFAAIALRASRAVSATPARARRRVREIAARRRRHARHRARNRREGVARFWQ